MASTEYGCQMLLQHGLLSRLAECQFIDFHVNSATAIFQSSMAPSHVNDPFVPSLDERYSKIFSSLAKLVLAFLTQSGLRHKTVTTQVRATSKYMAVIFFLVLHQAYASYLLTLLSCWKMYTYFYFNGILSSFFCAILNKICEAA